MEATEPRQFRKTAIPHTASTKRPLREQQVKCTPQMGARRTARRVSMATALRWVRPQTAISMRPRTGTPTRTLEVVGAETRTIPRNPAQVIQEAILLRPKAGEDKKRVADPQRSGEPAEVAGNPSRQVLAARQARVVEAVGVDAAAAVAAGAVAGEPTSVRTSVA